MKKNFFFLAKLRSKIATSYIALFFYRLNSLKGLFYLYLYKLIFHCFKMSKIIKFEIKFYVFIYET